MSGKSKLLHKNSNKEFFQQGLNKNKSSSTNWRDWIGQDKHSAILACKKKHH